MSAVKSLHTCPGAEAVCLQEKQSTVIFWYCLPVGAQDALAHLFACELEQWFTAHSDLNKNKKDASTDKRLRKRSRKKCDRAIKRRGTVGITGGAKVCDAVCLGTAPAPMEIVSATAGINGVCLGSDAVWIDCQSEQKEINGARVIVDAEQSGCGTATFGSVSAPAEISCFSYGNESDCTGSETVRKRYLSTFKILKLFRKMCQRSKKTKQC